MPRFRLLLLIGIICLACGALYLSISRMSPDPEQSEQTAASAEASPDASSDASADASAGAQQPDDHGDDNLVPQDQGHDQGLYEGESGKD